jgi:hypothetical protein
MPPGLIAANLSTYGKKVSGTFPYAARTSPLVSGSFNGFGAAWQAGDTSRPAMVISSKGECGPRARPA